MNYIRKWVCYKFYDSYDYIINGKRFVIRNDTELFETHDGSLYFANGRHTGIKLGSLRNINEHFIEIKYNNEHNRQYIPRYGERYLYVDLADESLYGIADWLNDATDYHMLKLGLICPTVQECVKKAKEMLNKLGLEM